MRHEFEVFAVVAALCFIDLVSAGYPPVIFVPGDGGSRMAAKLNKPSTVHYICDKETNDYFTLWLNVELLAYPFVIDCWVDNIKLIYNNETRKTTNQPGVEIQIPGFGDPAPVEWLDPSRIGGLYGGYFKDIGNALVAVGYERNVSIRGAPFDFRKGPSESQEYFANLKALVEETYEANKQEKVLFVVHSMGGPMSVLFFQMQTQAWKDKYIAGMVSLSGAFAGSIKALKVFVMGDNLGVYVLHTASLKQMQITSPSLAWLMPNKAVWKDEILANTETKNYTLANIQDFFEVIDYTTGYEMYKDQLPYTSLAAPGVEVHCLHGTGVETISRLTYKPGKFPDSPNFEYGSGDGTVNLESLEYCTNWSKEQKQKVYHQAFVKMDHMKILSDQQITNYILSVVKNYKKKKYLQEMKHSEDKKKKINDEGEDGEDS